MNETQSMEINKNELFSLAQCALLVGLHPKKFQRLAAALNMECIKSRDGRGVIRLYRLGEVLAHREELREEPELPLVRDQRNRCIMALRRFQMSYEDIAAAVGGITRQRIHQIVTEEHDREEALRSTVTEVFVGAQEEEGV